MYRYYFLILIILFFIKIKFNKIKELALGKKVGKFFPIKSKKIVNLNLEKDNFNIINDKLKVNIVQINDNKKILLIDNFLRNPKMFDKIKNNMKNFWFDNGSAYPGIRLDASFNIKYEFDFFIKKYVTSLLNFPQLDYYNFSNYSYSIIIDENKKLNAGNVLPHTDCHRFPDNKRKITGIAFVIYLFDENIKYSGTSLFETVIDYYRLLNPDLTLNINYKDKDILNYAFKIINNPKHGGDLAEKIFKKIFTVKAKYNRIGIYKTNYWHSADLDPDYFEKPQDLSTPRFTITGFYFPKNIVDYENHD